MSRGLGATQRAVLEHLRDGQELRALACDVYGLPYDGNFAALSEVQYRTVARAVRTLEKRGLLRGYYPMLPWGHVSGLKHVSVPDVGKTPTPGTLNSGRC